jgi:hypothetical protein
MAEKTRELAEEDLELNADDVESENDLDMVLEERRITH